MMVLLASRQKFLHIMGRTRLANTGYITVPFNGIITELIGIL